MSAEIRRLLSEACGMLKLLDRDAERQSVTDFLARAEHALLLPPAGSPSVEALVEQWQELGKLLDGESDEHYLVRQAFRRCAHQLKVALKAAPTEALHCTTVTFHQGDGYQTLHDVTLYRSVAPLMRIEED